MRRGMEHHAIYSLGERTIARRLQIERRNPPGVLRLTRERFSSNDTLAPRVNRRGHGPYRIPAPSRGLLPELAHKRVADSCDRRQVERLVRSRGVGLQQILQSRSSMNQLGEVPIIVLRDQLLNCP